MYTILVIGLVLICFGIYLQLYNKIKFLYWLSSSEKLTVIHTYPRKYAKIFYKECKYKNTNKYVITEEVKSKAINKIHKAGINKKNVLVTCLFYENPYYAYLDFETLSDYCRLHQNDFLGYSIYESDDKCFVVMFRRVKNK